MSDKEKETGDNEIAEEPEGESEEVKAPEPAKKKKKEKEAKTKGKKRRRVIWPWVVIAILAFMTLGGYGFYEYSNTPQFCNSCHIMQPYYTAWEESSHKDVACIECHISPEAGAKWEAKVQGMIQALKYITHTYSSKPYAEIEDSSCLRSGCHQERLVNQHSTETFKNNVVFDHAPHLLESRRGKELRCTSCHAQIVVGNHMEVTTSTCYLCHFRESADHDVEKLSECRLCHKKLSDRTIEHKVLDPRDPTKVIDTITFNHVDFIGDKEVDCRSCHLTAINGTGEAKTEQCFVCHNDPEHIERIGDIEFIHKNHITIHNVTCERCHDPIKHEVRTESFTMEQNCQRCHVTTHVGQREMYMGIGGRGIEGPNPGVMYRTMVDCAGCHIGHGDENTVTSRLHGYTKVVDFRSCEYCHGEDAEGFRELFMDSMNEVKERLVTVKAQYKNAKAALGRIGSIDEELKKRFDNAEFDLNFIELALGWAHNAEYSDEMFNNAEEVFDEILALNQ